nr:hypothetical protein [Tanacetum cinerariifolium]
MQTPGSGIFNLLAVGTSFTGSGNLYCQWELSPGSGNALCILFPTRGSKRRREGKEPESASAPSDTATKSADRTTTGSRSRQASASEVDTLILELLAGPTYDLMKGSCKSLIELEYHLEEVYKATTDQLDWVNPEGQQYPHNLLQPLPLIPDNRGRRIIPFAHFINNDLEYLCGGASSRKYITSVTKTKAADYRHIKWIEDLVPRTMLKKDQEKDKIRSKLDKNRKRGEAEKCQKQLQ